MCHLLRTRALLLLSPWKPSLPWGVFCSPPQSTICRLPSFLPLPDLEASVHFAYGSRSLVHLQMPRKPPAPLASALLLFVSLPTSTDQLDVRQGGLTQFEEENCARLVWVKGVYLPPPRLTVSGFLVLDTTFQLVA